MFNFKKIFVRNNIKKYAIQIIIILSIAVLGTFISVTRKTTTVVVDGKQTKFITFQSTVGNALKREHIIVETKDKLNKSLDRRIINNDIITIRRAVNLKVAVDGKELNIKSAEENIDSMLNEEKIPLSSEDKISPEKGTKLSEGMKVAITRVETKVNIESVPIAFKTEIKNDSDLSQSQGKILQEGKNGEKQITTNIVYENGNEISRKVIKEAVTKEPINKIVANATLSTLPLSRGSVSLSNGKPIRVKATAYCPNGKGLAYTSSGRKALRDPNGYSTIAVDPRVIPLGTKVYVENYGYAIAADEGGAIKGNIIDVFFDTYTEASNWGLKYVNLYILK